ncbi:MAG TPA: alanine--tRNA ligase [Candidatus Nanoarchaeia archaeon]|nr:alanine--tRNA ligase [Candidatus Nanoarchaeia archaeon]
MLSDKEMKKEFKIIAQKEPQKYYPTETLKNLDFKRKKCSKCGTFFWTTTERIICDDPQCSGGFRFLGKTPAKNKLEYLEVWEKFSKTFKKFGYTPIKRMPVVARWNPSVDFTIASITAFQPFVVSGEVKPPVNPLVIPQVCLRFSDVDNIGVTGHFVGFIMMGQHCFVPPKDYNTNKYLEEIYNWLNKGLGIPKNELTFHEDAWAGGGNFGSSIEFFSRGLELGNQVYMQYEQAQTGYKELPIKVLDMGAGQERAAWFTQGEGTSYDAAFPTVCNSLYKLTGLWPEKDLTKRFLPLASYLNVDEVEDLEKSWRIISKKIEMNVEILKQKILPLSELYSIGEHSRSLLFALNDGALFSNSGGGYNLRMLARRCFNFIEKNNWQISLPEVCEWHAKYLKKQYPEVTENLAEVRKLLDVEKFKYDSTKQKSKEIVEKIIKNKENVTADKLIELYDSNGIQPEVIKEELNKVNVNIKVPDNFYSLVAGRHENKEQVHATVKEINISLDNLPETKTLYYKDYKLSEFDAKVLKSQGPYLVLDQTVFYPTSGGQLHDVGVINNLKVLDVVKQGKIIVHVLENNTLKEGEKVHGKIDYDRRIQLAQHHTSTHIINAAARDVLGKHVNQAGAKKTLEKAHIDITHYQSLSDEELKKIEKEANKIIKDGIGINKSFMPREAAEKKYGFVIYQGGVPIGKELRIVDIKGIDVEACGGTHLDNTKEAVKIKILKSTKISDSIVRIEFVAGKKASEEEHKEKNTINELAKLLYCKPSQVPFRVEELFNLWKDVVKKNKPFEFVLISNNEFHGDIISKSCEILKTQPEHLVNTVIRFIKEIKDKKH